jgi:hypothetical protein
MANAKMRRCSWAARGAWAAVLCTMHDSDEYGVLRYPLAEIAQSIGCKSQLLRELADKGVMKGGDGQHDGYIYRPRHAGKEGQPVTLVEAGSGPCWYSSRMVRDEYIRSKAGATTRFQPVDKSGNNSPRHRQGEPPGDTPSQREGHGAIAFDSVSIHIGVDGDDNAGPREPHPLGDSSPSKVNGKGKPPPGWHRTPEGIEKAGRMLGIQAKRGEDYDGYKSRIFEALRA